MTNHPLREFRQNNQMTPAELARFLGVSRITVWRWESGNRKIDLGKLTDVSEKTKIPAAELRPDIASLVSGEAA